MNDKEHGLECLSQLNGTIYLIPGNHDTDTKMELYKTLPNMQVLSAACGGLQPAAATLKYKKLHLYLSHHPTITSNFDDGTPIWKNLLCVHGHTHQQHNFYQDIPYIYHIGMDSHNCEPVHIDIMLNEMREEIKKRKEELPCLM